MQNYLSKYRESHFTNGWVLFPGQCPFVTFEARFLELELSVVDCTIARSGEGGSEHVRYFFEVSKIPKQCKITCRLSTSLVRVCLLAGERFSSASSSSLARIAMNRLASSLSL